MHRSVKYAEIICILIFISLGLVAQDMEDSRVQVDRTRVTRVFSVFLSVIAVDQNLTVPFCGENEGGTRLLCSLPTQLEIKTTRGWVSAKVKNNNLILGGAPVDKWEAGLIKKQQYKQFVFMIPIDEFNIEPESELRLVVDAWPDEASMRSGKNPLKLISAVFKIP